MLQKEFDKYKENYESCKQSHTSTVQFIKITSNDIKAWEKSVNFLTLESIGDKNKFKFNIPRPYIKPNLDDYLIFKPPNPSLLKESSQILELQQRVRELQQKPSSEFSFCDVLNGRFEKIFKRKKCGDDDDSISSDSDSEDNK
tara:strand:- start:596 stop:1024 length:429 start_codon:yes stop_codon:yes gene_type:complete